MLNDFWYGALFAFTIMICVLMVIGLRGELPQEQEEEAHERK